MDVDMSLDEIIRQKKIGGTKPRQPNRPAATRGKPMIRKTLHRPINRVVDARHKIIQKKRAKIRDARDRLVELNRTKVVDAREKISKNKARLRATTNGHHAGPTNVRARTSSFRSPIKIAPKRVVDVKVPRGYVDYDNMERLEEEEYAAAARLSRTVKNDLTYPTFGDRHMSNSGSHLDSWNSDPFNVYDIPRSHEDRMMTTEILPPPPPKGILRNSTAPPREEDLYQRRFVPDPQSHLSFEMRSRLTNAPDPHASMGIFANPAKAAAMPMPIVSSNGFRIVVSNLHTSVTKADIQELFEDVGDLYDSRIVRPGVAEVVYKSLRDAERAVETYHNRQLDGLPMKCLLVHPRASNKPTAPAIKTSSSSRSNSGKTPLEIDIDALHKVLFRRN